ncbi:hypothetical protein LR48_Vigan743s001300 [Vigna angularis]|uniref:Uncharacterized protein n=1 Tax=Phaseolus angularis TaxID=3914 RepID=A0A0L9TGK9_PHAAN|nr:hypothetical protein LR48_Vigan743s001300 [Vigna angularis]
MQAFLAMCLAVGVTPTILVFFHYFEVRPPPQGGWVSLTSVRNRTLFRPYSDSFKNFKHHYFNIIIDASGRREFHDTAGNPLFPFYWTRELLRPRQAHQIVQVINRKDPAGEGHKDKEASSSWSASKKARKGKEKAPSPPVPGGIFSPAFNMSDWTKFHMSSSQRALIEPLSEVELTNAMLEMSTRAASLASYLREFADHRGVDVVLAELLTEKKNFASLRSAMEEMILTPDEYDKKIELLEADLEKAKKESADVSDRLTVARNDYERLMEECSQLKAKVSRQKSSENELLRSNRVLTDDLAKAKEKISELEAGIVFEHEEGFNKALRQASVLAGIQEPFALGFDIEKDVFDGVLVDLNTMVDDEAPEIEGPPGAAVADEAVEVEDVDDEAEDGDS